MNKRGEEGEKRILRLKREYKRKQNNKNKTYKSPPRKTSEVVEELIAFLCLFRAV